MTAPVEQASMQTIARIASALVEALIKRPVVVVVLAFLGVIGLAIWSAVAFAKSEPLIFGMFLALVFGALLVAVLVVRSISSGNEHIGRATGDDGDRNSKVTDSARGH